MKYWKINESLDRRIALKNYDKDAYLHTVNSAFLLGILITLLFMKILILT